MKNSDDEMTTRMSRDVFNILLDLVRDNLTRSRQRFGAEERLEVTLL